MATMARGLIRRMRNIVGAAALLRRSTSHSFLFQNPSLSPPNSHLLAFSTPHTPCSISRHISGETSDEGAYTDGWEEEDEAEPEIGDGGSGGGVALQNVPWGQRALSIAEEVLMQFSEDIKLYAFKTTPRGYVYVRLDKLTNEYGCPSMEELECYNQEFKKRLDEVGALGEIPDDLGLEVSSPGADRILKVPDDISRFKDMPMRVFYAENIESNCPEGDGVFLLDSIEKDTEICVWKLANVKENRDPQRKGRPLSRKQKDWRLRLPFNLHRMVPIVPNHVHSINDSVSAEEAADEYEFVIRQSVKTRVVSVSEVSDCPKFDLILLGLGPDGHVASLFPDHSAIDEREEWVTFITDSPKPPPERITFTLPVINSASNVAVVVTGDGKADAVHLAIGDVVGPDCPLIPARLVQPATGKLVWFLDTLAASKLKDSNLNK